MKLYHVSEEPNITIFHPRLPTRNDLDQSIGLVWTINEQCLPNFLTPRDCPRVTYHASRQTSQDDIDHFFSSSARHCVAIEHNWFELMVRTELYLYEFDPQDFYLQDEVAGFYVSEKTQKPISVTKINHIFNELFIRGVEVRILDDLWQLADGVQNSTLNWSLCRMRNAKPRK